VGAIVAVENTGNVEKDFFLGYSVYDESGTSYDNSEQTGQSISLAPGEVEYYYQSDIHWTVEDSAPTGSYDAETSVWAESDRDNLQTRLDRERINDAFEVRAPELSVTPQTEDVGNVPRDDPERVRYEVNNEGVGDLNWDIISGSFAVVDRGGDWFEVEYTQAGEFDTDITVLALNDHLEGDSTQTVEYRGYGTVEPGIQRLVGCLQVVQRSMSETVSSLWLVQTRAATDCRTKLGIRVIFSLNGNAMAHLRMWYQGRLIQGSRCVCSV